jgi:acyl-CoA reductase-like NAD-dependent aldehyde dehydrogenase
MVITMEETFGPVPRLHRFKSEEDVITSSRVVTERTTRGAQRLTS